MKDTFFDLFFLPALVALDMQTTYKTHLLFQMDTEKMMK